MYFACHPEQCISDVILSESKDLRLLLPLLFARPQSNSSPLFLLPVPYSLVPVFCIRAWLQPSRNPPTIFRKIKSAAKPRSNPNTQPAQRASDGSPWRKPGEPAHHFLKNNVRGAAAPSFYGSPSATDGKNGLRALAVAAATVR
jgi:hypothetical protein